MTRRYALLTLTVTAIFLMIVGVLTRGQQLFYMSTVMIVTLIMMRVQAEFAVRGLRFERVAPKVIVAGELIAIRIRVWSQLRIRRPLLIITDVLPERMAYDVDLRPLPVAPNYEEAVETRYELRARRRGVYRWSKVRVRSTDSMGIVSVERLYEADPIELVVHPSRISLGFDLAALTGWGANQSDEGKNRGAGMHPQGVREYATGDSLRFVHWRTTAKTGVLQVKEFETGFNTNLVILPQLTRGSEFGEGAETTLEAMCGNAAYISDVMLGRGSAVSLPTLEGEAAPAHSSDVRFRQLCDVLSGALADHDTSFADEIAKATKSTPYGCTFIVMVSIAEPGLSDAILTLSSIAPVLLLVYDAQSFSTRRPSKDLATNPEFLASVSRSGIRIKIVSNPFQTHDKAA